MSAGSRKAASKHCRALAAWWDSMARGWLPGAVYPTISDRGAAILCRDAFESVPRQEHAAMWRAAAAAIDAGWSP